MADVKWIKIVTDIFDDEKILLIEQLPEADSIIVIWFKLLCLAGKQNNCGVFKLNDKIAYTEQMLATIFRRKESTVRLALSTFESLGMVEIVENVITIPNWGKHQNIEKIEKNREYKRLYMQEYRAKQKAIAGSENTDLIGCNDSCNSLHKQLRNEHVDTPDKNRTEENRKELEGEKEEEYNDAPPPSSSITQDELKRIVDAWNALDLTKVSKISSGTTRHKMLKARIKEYGVDAVVDAIKSISEQPFLLGNNSKGWTATFDWIIKPDNFPKVIEGNYRNYKHQEMGRINKAEERINEVFEWGKTIT